MNTLVVYDSLFGNTEKIAKQIALTLTEFGTSRAVGVAKFTPDMLVGVNLLVIGCPTQAWHSTPVMKNFIAYLQAEPTGNLCIAPFDTRLDKPSWLTGSAARAMAKQLRPLPVTLLIAPESFCVTGKEGPLDAGEIERAVAWAHLLYEKCKVFFKPETETAETGSMKIVPVFSIDHEALTVPHPH